MNPSASSNSKHHRYTSVYPCKSILNRNSAILRVQLNHDQIRTNRPARKAQNPRFKHSQSQSPESSQTLPSHPPSTQKAKQSTLHNPPSGLHPSPVRLKTDGMHVAPRAPVAPITRAVDKAGLTSSLLLTGRWGCTCACTLAQMQRETRVSLPRPNYPLFCLVGACLPK